MASSPSSPTSPNGKKLVNTKSGLRMISLMDDERSALEIDEPLWQNDKEHLICNKCGKRFTFKIRRHHCRRCGMIFCSDCCSAKIALPRLSFVDPQRVCINCTSVAKREIEVYEKFLPILAGGADFQANNKYTVKCKLEAKCLRELRFTDVQTNTQILDSIVLKDITSFQCLTDPLYQTSEGKGQLIGVNMKYVNDNTVKQMKLQVDERARNRKESLLFLITLQKIMKIIFEST